LPASGDDEPQTEEELRAAEEFAEKDPKDKGNRKVRYRKEKNVIIERLAQQDMQYMLAAAMAAMAKGGKRAELYRKRMQNGMRWDKELKTWNWKD
jgi:hypothetical protein